MAITNRNPVAGPSSVPHPGSPMMLIHLVGDDVYFYCLVKMLPAMSLPCEVTIYPFIINKHGGRYLAIPCVSSFRSSCWP